MPFTYITTPSFEHLCSLIAGPATPATFIVLEKIGPSWVYRHVKKGAVSKSACVVTLQGSNLPIQTKSTAT